MEHLHKSSGQTVYAPVYSHIYVGAQGQEFQLAATLCVRNTSIDNPIKLESVGYYDSSGKFLRNLVKVPVKIGPLGEVVTVGTRSGQGISFVSTGKVID